MNTLSLLALLITLGTNPNDAPSSPPAIRAAQAAFYRTGLPTATRFVAKAIPPAMTGPADRDNLTYLEAYDSRGKLLGYLRDFTGPVSPAESCPCNPLNLTLVFGPDKQFRTLIAPAPLQKWGHEAMTRAEQKQLVDLVRSPSEALMQVRRVEDVVDVTTGATRLELATAVVPRAGLSTRRIAGLVRDTRDILQGAPVGRDRQRLYDILNQNISSALLARRLSDLLPTLETDDLRQQAYAYLVNSYVASLAEAPEGDAALENRLLSPSIGPQLTGPAVARACYQLADRGLRQPLVERCINSLSKPGAPPTPNESLQLLRGTSLFTAGKMSEAISPLLTASRKMSVMMEPALHLRLGRAYVATQQAEAACPIAQALYIAHPLMPGVKELLASCSHRGKTAETILSEATAAAKTRFLAKARPPSPSSQTGKLSLETNDGSPIEVALADPDKITVVMFFATWCPHCRVEMPRIKDFAQSLNARDDLRTRVRVVGVRTAVERDSEPYNNFVQQFAPNFPVYTDPTMSLAFSQFAKTIGIPAALPTTAVIDDTGAVRFLLESGDWRDTQSELMWAVESLLMEAPAPTPKP